MSEDLISRQMAIDAIRKEYAGIHNANIDGDFLADEIEFIITKLPSVQPNTIGTTTDTTIGTTTDTTTDCISRQGAIDALIRAGKPINNGDGTLTIMPLTNAVIRKVLTALPSVQEQKKGYDTGLSRWFHCSECGYGVFDVYLDDEQKYDLEYHYCPNCGAHMEGAEE